MKVRRLTNRLILSARPRNSKTVFRLAAFLVVVACPAWAQRAFPLTWDSATLAKDAREVQSWLTAGYGRADTSYTRFGLRMQLAQGLTDRVDTMFGLDLDLESSGLDTRAFDARASNTWRLSLLKSTDAVGFSVLGRLALGVDLGELEVRIVVDKQLGPVWLAFNASLSRSQFWAGRTGIDTRLEQTLAVRYQVQGPFSAGLEVRSREAFQRAAYQGTGWSGGPTFTFAQERWWFALGLYAQVAADKAPADRGNGEPLEVRDNERFVGRLVVGIKTD